MDWGQVHVEMRSNSSETLMTTRTRFHPQIWSVKALRATIIRYLMTG